MTGPRVLISCPQMQNAIGAFRDRLVGAGLELNLPAVVQRLDEEQLVRMIGDYDGMIAGDDELTARVLERAERLRIISKWGVGVDGIDLDAARARGIAVTNTPGAFGDDVADVAAGYLVMLARQLHRIDASVKAGGWFKHEGITLAGKTLGILGYGSIGRAIGRRGHGFGMTVLAHDVVPGDGAELVGLDDLFRRSDFVVLAVPLLPETRHVVTRERLALLRPGSFLVNVSRGQLVDEAALVEALDSGQVAAAALDVFEHEPLPATSPLRRFEQCVFGSHNGSNTSEGVLRASAIAVDNLLAGLGLA